MPSERETTDNGPSVARNSSAACGRALGGPPPSDDEGNAISSVLRAAESEAAKGDSVEGDELLRRMQSALEEDEGVDMLLPSLPALRVLPGGGADEGHMAAVPPSASSSTIRAVLDSESSSSGSGDVRVPVEDPSARSRNMGLGLAALHKLQQQQRITEEQQQARQQFQDMQNEASVDQLPEKLLDEVSLDQSPHVQEDADRQQQGSQKEPGFPQWQGRAVEGSGTDSAAPHGISDVAVKAVDHHERAAALTDGAATAGAADVEGISVKVASAADAAVSRPQPEVTSEAKADVAGSCTRTTRHKDSSKISHLGLSSPLTSEGNAQTAAFPTDSSATTDGCGGIMSWSCSKLRPPAVSIPAVTAEEAAALQAVGGHSGPVEAAVREEAETIEATARELQQQVEQLLQDRPQQGKRSAVDALAAIEERLRLALEAVDADVASVQREAATTSSASVLSACLSASRPSICTSDWQQLQHLLQRQQQQQRETEISHGDEGDGEDEEGFKTIDSMDSTSVAAVATGRAAAPASDLWSEPCRALLRAALQSAGRQLPRGRRRGARGGLKEWGEAVRHRPPLDVLCLAAAQTKAECSLTPEEAAAAAAAAAVAATAAASHGCEAAATAAATAAEALLPPAAAIADGIRRVSWLPAEGPMVDTLAAANHSQAFAAGLPLLRLRRLGLSGDHQLHRRGPVWVDVPSIEEEEEGPKWPPFPFMSSSYSEQLLLFLRRDLFPASWLEKLQQQSLSCKAQLLLPSERESEWGLNSAVAGQANGGQLRSEPILRLRLFSQVSAFAGAGRLSRHNPATAAHRLVARGSESEEKPGFSQQDPLVVDEALRLLSAQQEHQQQALQQLLLQLRHLSQGISTQQLAILASLVDSKAHTDAAVVPVAVGDLDAVVFSRQDSNAPTGRRSERVGGNGCEGAETGQQRQQQLDQQQHLKQLQNLQQWLSLFHPFGISASRAIALLAAAGEQQPQLEPEGEPVDVVLNFRSLMPFPEEDPGIVLAFSVPYKPGPVQPWKWDLRLAEGGRCTSGSGLLRGPLSIQKVRRQIARRQQRLSFLLQQQKIVCKTFYKSWRSHRRQVERRRIAAGDIFGWGVLPVRAIDHPSLLMALPAGFRQGNPKEPYEKQYSRDAAEDGGNERLGARRSADVTGRRTLRGDACNDRQKAKEEAASRESKREWMQANFSNLTGPGVFWRDSCLFSQGQSLRQRLEKQQENSGVHPVELVQTDPDWALFDWERECGYTCNTTRVLQPLEQEAERKAVTIWAEAEARTFVEKFLMYPKNFEKIAACLDGKNTRDCVDFYYRFKYKFSLKRRLQELEDGTRVKKRNRHVGSKQIRREELVAEAVAGLSSDCETALMRCFNGQNFLPFDAFSDHLLQRDALQATLKDPLACRGEDWNDCDSDGAEIFVENMSDGYFLPATIRGLVAPSSVVSMPADAGLWGSIQRTFVPGCLVIEMPQRQTEEERNASPPPIVSPPTLKYEQLDTLLTCMQASARRFGLPDEEGPSYMTRSRAARSRPGVTGSASTAAGLGCLQLSSGACRNGGGVLNASFGSGGGQQSPRAKAMDSLLLRLKEIVRGMQQTARMELKEKRRCDGEEPEEVASALARSPSSSLRLRGEESQMAVSE
ncbi:hypothetical protein Efla_000858 [Eimeria flavescens]